MTFLDRGAPKSQTTPNAPKTMFSRPENTQIGPTILLIFGRAFSCWFGLCVCVGLDVCGCGAVWVWVSVWLWLSTVALACPGCGFGFHFLAWLCPSLGSGLIWRLPCPWSWLLGLSSALACFCLGFRFCFCIGLHLVCRGSPRPGPCSSYQ